MGCRVNRADSARMAAVVQSGGFEITHDEGRADLFVLNTCTVTAKADAEVRQILRRLHRKNPAARVVVAGCFPRVSPDPGDEFRPYCAFLTGPDNAGLIEAISRHEARGARQEGKTTDGDAPSGSAPSPHASCLMPVYGDRVRPFLKVQDGCDSACTYCIVPRARGRSRSIPSDDVLAQASALIDSGYREIVLAGIHLGEYGRDRGERHGLLRLLGFLSDACGHGGRARIRLSSLEPLEVTPELVAFVADSGFICRHFHVPMQSGSDDVLGAMNRPYDVATYRAVVDLVKSRVPDACIGADVISGFPGESGYDHNLTLKNIGTLPIDYLHVFRFSPRPGTAAAGMAGRPKSAEVSSRVAELRALGEEKRAAFHCGQDGRTVEAIVERRMPKGGWNALTDNYIRAEVKGDGLKTGLLADIVLAVDAAGAVTALAEGRLELDTRRD